MNIQIFNFSGTGNSFAVARAIAEKIGGDLISIPSVMNMGQIHIDAESMGIVFPSYLAPLSGVPLMVERFVRKIDNIQSLNIFAVCTCGGYESVNALPALSKLKRIINSCGGKLSAGYSTRLPMNNLDYDHIPIPIVRDQDIILTRSRSKVEDICRRLQTKKREKYRTGKSLFGLLMAPLYGLIRKPAMDALKEKAREQADTKLSCFDLIPLTDRSIAVDENCKGCGTCTKVCPAGNIRIVDGKPAFLHRCEMCFACDEWCPSNAIHHWGRRKGTKYHHPEVKITDLFRY